MVSLSKPLIFFQTSLRGIFIYFDPMGLWYAEHGITCCRNERENGLLGVGESESTLHRQGCLPMTLWLGFAFVIGPRSLLVLFFLSCSCALFLWDTGNSFIPREKLVLHDASRINFQVFSSGEGAEPVTRGITLSEQLSTAVIGGNIKEQKEG